MSALESSTVVNQADFEVSTELVLSIEEDAGVNVALLVQAVLYYSIGVLGFFGNLLVVVVIFQYTKMRQILTNVYVINQSLIDGMAGLILIFTRAFQFNYDRPLSGFWGEVFCRVWVARVPLWSLTVSSSCNLVALTIERYMAVVHPVYHRVSFSKFKVTISMICIWLSGFILQLTYKVPTAGVTATGQCVILRYWPSLLVKRGIGVFLVVLEFFLPLAIMIFCYTQMYQSLNAKIDEPKPKSTNRTGMTSERTGNEAGRPETGGDLDKNAKVRNNIMKTLIIVCICFSLCWVWNQGYYFLNNIGVIELNYASPFITFSVVCVYLNCCINPIIYIIHYQQFRKGLRLLKRKITSRVGVMDTTASSSVGTSSALATGSTNLVV